MAYVISAHHCQYRQNDFLQIIWCAFLSRSLPRQRDENHVGVRNELSPISGDGSGVEAHVCAHLLTFGHLIAAQQDIAFVK